ncbi:MAG: hypothetical protein MASP_00689 [Candidatus Methanolliviera sp. GoM_asphalt]|nr:MAG: hypothetical protein MASP_00689 [Candidatus Methanolliviera sp. GoM_asphalt]
MKTHVVANLRFPYAKNLWFLSTVKMFHFHMIKRGMVLAKRSNERTHAIPAQSENLVMVCSFSPDDFVVGSQKSKIFEDIENFIENSPKII